MRKGLLTFLTVILALTLCILVGAFIIAFMRGDIRVVIPGDSLSTEPTIIETTAPETEAPASEHAEPALTPVQEPSNGYIFEDFEGLEESICPFTVETASSEGYYFVIDPIRIPYSGSSEFDKLTHEATVNYCEIRFYARSNSVVDILVPLGEYEIYYATGDTWYGEDLLFGPDTQYYKCEGIFEFTEDYDSYSGWTLQLQSVYNGNLDTTMIKPEDFPE